jgi:KTSC domain
MVCSLVFDRQTVKEMGMGMEYKKLSGGNLSKAGYDAASNTLEVHFVDGKIKRFKAVQREVFNRFYSAPNPATYYDDRIRDEYAHESDRVTSGSSAAKKLDDLFG